MILNQQLPIVSVEDDVEAANKIGGIRWSHQCNNNITLYTRTKILPRYRDTASQKHTDEHILHISGRILRLVAKKKP